MNKQTDVVSACGGLGGGPNKQECKPHTLPTNGDEGFDGKEKGVEME